MHHENNRGPANVGDQGGINYKVAHTGGGKKVGVYTGETETHMSDADDLMIVYTQLRIEKIFDDAMYDFYEARSIDNSSEIAVCIAGYFGNGINVAG